MPLYLTLCAQAQKQAKQRPHRYYHSCNKKRRQLPIAKSLNKENYATGKYQKASENRSTRSSRTHCASKSITGNDLRENKRKGTRVSAVKNTHVLYVLVRDSGRQHYCKLETRRDTPHADNRLN